MVYGRTPFSSLKFIKLLRQSPIQIYCIEFPTLGPGNASLLGVMKSCLNRSPSERAKITGPGGLLSHQFLHPKDTVQTGIAVSNVRALLVDIVELKYADFQKLSAKGSVGVDAMCRAIQTGGDRTLVDSAKIIRGII